MNNSIIEVFAPVSRVIEVGISSGTQAAGQQGPQGPAGSQGPQGETGLTGPAGAAGTQGEAGPAGAVGPQGPQGETGPTGPIGLTGAVGPQGAQGETGPTGLTGPQGETGPQGPAGTGGGGSGTFSDLTDKPTTLAGYGITDAEKTVPKSVGYAKWTGTAWLFVNEYYMPTSHAANAISGGSITDWNAAHGWGNHASAGYLTAATAAATYQPVGSYQAAGSYESPLTFSNGVSRTGNAISVTYGTAANTVAQGNDARLSDSRPASDVYAWAKAATKPAYTPAEIGSPSGSGTSTGTNTGDQTSVSGNSGTATALSAGADRTKLDGIAAGATANSSDATLLNRASHTGSQAISTVTGLQTALDGKQAAGTYATGTGSATGTNTGDNAANTLYAGDYRAANFVANTHYLAPGGSTTFGQLASTAMSMSASFTAGGLMFEAQGTGATAGAAFLTFHRPGIYAVHFGVDTDNKLKFGGWSEGAITYEIYHAKNIATQVLGHHTTGLGFLDKGNSSTTAQTIDYAAATHQKLTVTGAFVMNAVTNWPTSGRTGELLLELVNGASSAITWTMSGTTQKWWKSDGTSVATYALSGVTFQTTGTNWILMWSTDAGTTTNFKVMT